MKYLCIPDLHGKAHVLDYIIARYPYPEYTLIFIGDYVDSFDEPMENQLYCFITVAKLVKEKRAVALLGNHDYWYINRRASRGSGYKHNTKYHMERDCRQWYPCFKYYHVLPTFPNGITYLFTHAGVSGEFLTDHGIAPTIDAITKAFDGWIGRDYSPFFDIGWSRNGQARIGGPMWCDYFQEFKPVYDNVTINTIKQIFGHSGYIPKVLWKEEYAIHPPGILENDGNYNIDCLQRVNEFLEIQEDGSIITRKHEIPDERTQ